MRELSVNEVNEVSGGAVSGYEGAGAILAVLGTAAAIATAPISSPIIAIAVGAAAGLAAAQALADLS